MVLHIPVRKAIQKEALHLFFEAIPVSALVFESCIDAYSLYFRSKTARNRRYQQAKQAFDRKHRGEASKQRWLDLLQATFLHDIGPTAHSRPPWSSVFFFMETLFEKDQPPSVWKRKIAISSALILWKRFGFRFPEDFAF